MGWPRKELTVNMRMGLALALLLAGCQRDGFWTRKRPVPAQLESAPVESVTDSLTGTSSGRYGDFQQIFADVAEAALPAVVSIRSEKQVAGSSSAFGESPFDFFFGPPDTRPHREEGLGSGVIIDSDGTILTNNHVIEGASRVRVQLHDDREFDAEILGADKPSDLAVIRIKGAKETFAVMRLGDSDKLRVGEWVIAVGSPYGLSQTVTTGIISAKGRHNTGINSYENFLQTDAAINPGNSGGALLNLRGELVGINTAIFSRSGGYQGIGFAIPISMARKISADLIREGAVTRGWLGVSIQALEPELADALGVKDRKGVLVGGVVPGSPADKAGIKRGDVITRINEKAIQNPNDLLNYVALQLPGAEAQVEVNREGKSLGFKVRIAKRDEKRMSGLQREEEKGAARLSELGLQLADLSAETRREYDLDPNLVQGVVVTGVESGSRASRAKLRAGDVLVEANRSKIINLSHFQDILGKTSKGNRVLLLVNREGDTFFTAF